MKATDLLKAENTEFMAFLSVWKAHREPPLPFADWLEEQGLHTQSEAIKWVLRQPIRKNFYQEDDKNPNWTLPSLPFPLCIKGDYYNCGPNKSAAYSWATRAEYSRYMGRIKSIIYFG